MALVNMQMSAEEAKEETGCSTDVADAPRYPYGLELSLDDDALTKLGITTFPSVGTRMQITAMATVTRTSAYQTQGSEQETSMGLQITDMALAPSDGPSAADVLYGAKG